jgi:hypothetical protein
MSRERWRRLLITLALAFGAAVILNWAILALFGQRSADRAQHSLLGILLLMACVYLMHHKEARVGAIAFFTIALIPCYLGTVFPDLDITLLGIGSHRNPLFHSSLSFLVLLALVKRKHMLLRTLVLGYGVGLASHLLWDIYDYGNVHWLPGGFIDRLWLGVNGLACLVPLGIESDRHQAGEIC